MKLVDIYKEVKVNNPNSLFQEAKSFLNLQIAMEFFFDRIIGDENEEEIIEKLEDNFNISGDDTKYMNIDELSYPIKSVEDLKMQILLKNKFKNK